MNDYEFALIVDRDPTEPDIADALYEADQGGSIPEGGGGEPNLIHVTRVASNLIAAIVSAMHTVEATGLHVVGVSSDDLVSLSDIASRTDRSYESVRLLAAGKRGPGNFPAPLATDQWGLYSWTLVSRWLSEHANGEPVSEYDRAIAAADHVIRARSILAGDKNRAEFAELIVA